MVVPQTIRVQCGNTVRGAARGALGQGQASLHPGPEGMNVHSSTLSSRTSAQPHTLLALGKARGLSGNSPVNHQSCVPWSPLGSVQPQNWDPAPLYTLMALQNSLWPLHDSGFGVGEGADRLTFCLPSVPTSSVPSKPSGIH